jgi:hypothetical protein
MPGLTEEGAETAAAANAMDVQAEDWNLLEVASERSSSGDSEAFLFFDERVVFVISAERQISICTACQSEEGE